MLWCASMRPSRRCGLPNPTSGNPEEFDPDELDAPAEAGKYAIACYVDLLPRNDRQWQTPDEAIAAAKAICARYRSGRFTLLPRRPGRAPRLHRHPPAPILGITAYLTACGSTPMEAARTLAAALGIFVDAVLRFACPTDAKFEAKMKERGRVAQLDRAPAF